jgi:Adenylate cyclase, family 3 (some proteins contain HAMP domain)
MTEQRGDELAARLAGRLQELAESAARTHGGRVIKLLGDGVMLRFDRPGNAVEASLHMVAAAPSADLPMAHAGIHAGPLIERDGDFYGHTVNLAARIVSAADAGQVVVSQAVIDGVADGSVHFEPLATVPLKGVTQPVALFLASRRAP